ncbi:MAG: tRNA (adenosine(37)-N6)-threonylcarbamoyltransferase complex transferase subunit TsaD [bacterium]
MNNTEITTLGIETSCDETSAAVLQGGKILSNLVSSQVELHAPFGGVVPELAARQHEAKLNKLVELALNEADKKLADVQLIGVTVGPGLAVSLAVGIACARAMASLLKVPCLGISHLQGHLLANFIQIEQNTSEKLAFPAVCLLVSGGHTEIFLMRSTLEYEHIGGTVDDAAGEAFDKIARLLNLGYPGGPAIEKASEHIKQTPIKFPRPMLSDDNFNFSFSGLKTAVINFIRNNEGKFKTDEIAFAFQEAVVDVLTEKTVNAALKHGVQQVFLGGGVSANRVLREKMKQKCMQKNIKFHSPPMSLCTDNGAMIAFTAHELYINEIDGHRLTPIPNLLI